MKVCILPSVANIAYTSDWNLKNSSQYTETAKRTMKNSTETFLARVTMPLAKKEASMGRS